MGKAHFARDLGTMFNLLHLFVPDGPQLPVQ